MIKIYGMNTCPDCIAVDKHVEGDNRYEVIDIGSHIKYQYVSYTINHTKTQRLA